MDQAFFDQLDHWHRQEQFQQIIDAIEAIPAEQRGYELTGLLARAYANTGAAGETDPFEKAVSLLRSTEAEGADDPNWHFRMGYALYYLDREEEAIPHLRRVLNLVPDDPETQAFVEVQQEAPPVSAKERRRAAEKARAEQKQNTNEKEG